MLALLLACSSPAPRAADLVPPIVPRDAATGAGSGVESPERVVKDPFTLEVLGVKVVMDVVDPQTTQLAKDFTEQLRRAVREWDGITLGNSQLHLFDLEIMFNCESEAPPCTSKIAQHLDADRLLFGKIENRRGEVHAALEMLNRHTQQIVLWSGPIPSSDPQGSTAARDAITSLLSRMP